MIGAPGSRPVPGEIHEAAAGERWPRGRVLSRRSAVGFWVVRGCWNSVAGGDVDFESEVAPILVMRCLECHNAATASGDLVLTRDDSLRRGGKSGEVIVPGNPEESLLFERVLAGEMPPARRDARKSCRGRDPGLEDVDRRRSQVAQRANDRPRRAHDRDPRRPRLVVASSREAAGSAGDRPSRLGQKSDRCVHPREAGSRGDDACPASGSPHLDPPRLFRPARACRQLTRKWMHSFATNRPTPTSD